MLIFVIFSQIHDCKFDWMAYPYRQITFQSTQKAQMQ